MSEDKSPEVYALDHNKLASAIKTQEDFEKWILLKSQSGKRWFRLEVLDEELQSNPIVQEFLENMSELIFQGMIQQELHERMDNAEQASQIVQ